MANFSERLNQELKEHKVKKIDLAKKMYVTPQTVSRWCNGHIIPDDSTMQLLADFFRVNIMYLKGDCEKTNASDVNLDEIVSLSNAFTTMIEGSGYSITTETTPIGLHKIRENPFCKEYSTSPEVTWILSKNNKEIRLTDEKIEEIKLETLKFIDYQIRKDEN